MSDKPAFPSHGSMGEVTHEGLTRRELFAMSAMQGMLVNTTPIDRLKYDFAKASVEQADALIKALEVGDG